MLVNDKIFIAGHNGMVGGAIKRLLEDHGYQNLLFQSRSQLDLENSIETQKFFEDHRPKYVFLAAAKVGGIIANQKYPVQFLESNLKIQSNVISAAYKNGCKKLLFLGSSCIYPKLAKQPIKEDCLMNGKLEETNSAYAVAKIAGKELCDSYRKQYGFNAFTVMPSNVYGIGDNFDPEASHVVAGLMRRLYFAAQNDHSLVEIWGSGTPKRELIFSEDLADACLFLMKHYDEGGMINVGSSEEFSISEIAENIARVVGYTGEFSYDKTKPDGTPRKVMDNSRINNIGWKSKTPLDTGQNLMFEYYKKLC